MLDAAPPDLFAIAVEKGDGEVLLLQPIVGGFLKRRDREGEREDAGPDPERQRLAGELIEDAPPSGDMEPVHEGRKRRVILLGPLPALVERGIDIGVEGEKAPRNFAAKTRKSRSIKQG